MLCGDLNGKEFQKRGDMCTCTADSLCCTVESSTTLQSNYSEVKSLSHVWLFATPWTIAHQAPLSMEFSRQEYWSGLPFPSPGDLSNPGIKLGSPTLQADALPSEPPGKPYTPKELIWKEKKNQRKIKDSIASQLKKMNPFPVSNADSPTAELLSQASYLTQQRASFHY